MFVKDQGRAAALARGLHRCHKEIAFPLSAMLSATPVHITALWRLSRSFTAQSACSRIPGAFIPLPLSAIVTARHLCFVTITLSWPLSVFDSNTPRRARVSNFPSIPAITAATEQ